MHRRNLHRLGGADDEKCAIRGQAADSSGHCLAAGGGGQNNRGTAELLHLGDDFIEGMALGEPDLVVKLMQPYTLPAEGKDVYRNFVVPIPISDRKYVKGVEFLPGNAKVLHHAFINIDETRQSRRLAQQQNPPGFDGMELPESAIMPGGQLLGWQPGKTPSFVSEGLS